jgi:hypothetical protein
VPPRRKSPTPTLTCRRAEPCGGNSRREKYDTRRPNGEACSVERCLDCGAMSVTSTVQLQPSSDVPDDTTQEDET